MISKTWAIIILVLIVVVALTVLIVRKKQKLKKKSVISEEAKLGLNADSLNTPLTIEDIVKELLELKKKYLTAKDKIRSGEIEKKILEKMKNKEYDTITKKEDLIDKLLEDSVNGPEIYSLIRGYKTSNVFKIADISSVIKKVEEIALKRSEDLSRNEKGYKEELRKYVSKALEAKGQFPVELDFLKIPFY